MSADATERRVRTKDVCAHHGDKDSALRAWISKKGEPAIKAGKEYRLKLSEMDAAFIATMS